MENRRTAIKTLFPLLILLFCSTLIYLPRIENHGMAIVRQLQSSNVLKIRFSPKHTNGMEYTAFVETNTIGTSLQLNGQISYEENGQRFNYTLWEKRGYFSIESITTGGLVSSGCIDPDQLPPLDLLQQSIHQANVIDAINETGDRKGCEHKLLEIQFSGEYYLICINPHASDNVISSIHSEDMDAELTLLSEHPNDFFTIPSIIESCPMANPQEYDKSLFTNIKSNVNRWSRGLTRRLSSFDDGRCGCQLPTLKDCLFIHGSGQSYDGPLQSTFPEYWGQIEKHAPCCSSVSFMRLDTNNNPWYGTDISHKVCDTAKEIAGSRSNVIEDMIVVTHSVGNLILANSIASGRCSLGSSSMWVSSQGPFEGSESANRLQDYCLDPTQYSDSKPSYQEVFADNALEWLGFCPVDVSNSALVFEGGKYSDAELNEKYAKAQEAYRNNVNAAICGTSPFGIVSPASPKLQALSKISNHGSENDGLVAINSCIKSLPHKFSSDYRGNLFYRAKINHQDGKFKTNDGWWGESRKPIKWFECLF